MKTYKTERLTPVLVHQLQEAAHLITSEDDKLQIDGLELGTAQILARIVNHETLKNKIKLTVNDGTGEITLIINKQYDKELPDTLADVTIE